tara:strand:+ start:210 stop:950 length:741 start_codon:yes stop_codon:yes gene_type:complete
MSSKPKKTLSEEQLKKMQEGRKKAAQKRAKEREEAKAKAKELSNAKKSKDKEKLLQLELEALQQQQDRINNLKMQVERKKQVKSKLKSIKEVDEKPEDQVYEAPLEETDDEAEQTIEVLEKVEKKINKQIEHKETDDRDYVPNDEEYVATFAREAHRMRKNIPAETRKYYDEAIKKFDFTLSLDDNISSMIDYVKEVVKNNTELANGIRNKQVQKENKKEIVQKNVAEKVAEQSVDSKLHKLMKLK